MKQLMYGALIATPITALVMFFAFEGRKDVVLQQKAHEVQQQIQSEEFRRDFAQAWHDFDNPPTAEEQAAQEKTFATRQAEREARISRLEQQRESLSGDMDLMFKQLDSDMEDMRAALREAEVNPPKSN
ncbi:hypothetical protein V6D52_06455 [Idiomarina loihiensis]|uniref:hypothetical protein n=1 Tax=Idiomarina loihiensis TaxID=135577 RepID=UPI0039BDDA6B